MNKILRSFYLTRNRPRFTRNISSYNQVNFGILYDIDGVLVRGSHGVSGAKRMFEIINNSFNSKIPIVYLTNSCDSPDIKASFLRDIFDINIKTEHVIHAPAPLKLFTHVHNKRTFFVGQGNVKTIASNLKFKKPVDLSDIQKAYPTLDVMDKVKRRCLKNGYSEIGLEPIEAIVILGEPTDWQSYLQIIIDLLVTQGNLSAPIDMSLQTLPVYLCNLDLLYKAESRILRFGNGAFINCLETLYKKYTGLDLKYVSVIGKPGEISFRYAEHVLQSISNQINNKNNLERMYMIGDNPASDILGANLYQNFIDKPGELPSYRILPQTIDIFPRTVKSIKSFLVKTGVYNEKNLYCNRHQHWTFSDIDTKYLKPTMIVDDCLEAFYRILEMEFIQSSKKID